MNVFLNASNLCVCCRVAKKLYQKQFYDITWIFWEAIMGTQSRGKTSWWSCTPCKAWSAKTQKKVLLLFQKSCDWTW